MKKHPTHSMMSHRLLGGCGAAVLLFLHAPAPDAQVKGVPSKVTTADTVMRSSRDPAAGSLDEYLRRVHAESASTLPAPGALWTDGGRFTRLSADVRAMQPHDLISVVVSEQLDSSTDGTVQATRASSAQSAISALFQKLSASSAAANLLNMASSSNLNAQGQSANNSSLSTTLGGEVVEVLPNGMLVIEAARQVEFSQQTQTVGAARPGASRRYFSGEPRTFHRDL